MNDGQSAKQQIVERIKATSNILVTVSTDPSVDELTSALGLTMMLNNMNKHATAVVSGVIPSAITFLDPEKTFESTVDSLRDFIIALDKEKADHLRYKVDGDVVKIFITPYRTTITDNDLDFSQGDYNVELVLALGVRDRDHLDKALEAHGRILHDATVATLSCGENSSELGSIDWYESGASSIAEMLVSLSEALKSDKSLLDEQISTAYLTGIVAATDRFSNNKTSSKVMTMAAQLMAAGANQQLIAAKLTEAHEISSSESSNDSGLDDENSDGTTDMSEGKDTKLDRKSAKKKKTPEKEAQEEPKKDDGTLAISHEKEGSVDEVAKETDEENKADAAKEAESALADQLKTVAPTASMAPSIEDLQKDIAAASAEVDQAANDTPAEPIISPQPSTLPELHYEPTLGGTLNATSEQAAEDKRKEEANTQNKTILNHGEGKLADEPPTFAPPQFNAASPVVSGASDGNQQEPDSAPTVAAQSVTPPAPEQTLADLDKDNRTQHDDARAAVDAALNGAPFNPANQPQQNIGAQPVEEATIQSPAIPAQSVTPSVPTGLPPLPDFSTLPPPPPIFQPPVAPTVETNASSEPQSPEQLGEILGENQQTPSAPEQNSGDPAQFKIPGQS